MTSGHFSCISVRISQLIFPDFFQSRNSKNGIPLQLLDLRLQLGGTREPLGFVILQLIHLVENEDQRPGKKVKHRSQKTTSSI